MPRPKAESQGGGGSGGGAAAASAPAVSAAASVASGGGTGGGHPAFIVIDSDSETSPAKQGAHDADGRRIASSSLINAAVASPILIDRPSSSFARGAAVKMERGLRYAEEETGGAGKGKAADDDDDDGTVRNRQKVSNKVEEKVVDRTRDD